MPKEINLKHSRFKDAPWYPEKDTHVIIGGAGGIGSWTALLLTRAGFKPIVYDADLVEEHNLSGQLFDIKHIGEPKVLALQSMVEQFTGDTIGVETEWVTEETPTHYFAVSAFDNMKSRKIMFESWYEQYGSKPEYAGKALFIDPRLSIENLWIYSIVAGKEEDIETYRTKKLLLDSEIEEAPCSFKQTSHTAAMIGGAIVSIFTNHLTNIKEGEEMRSVPFSWTAFTPLMLFEDK